MKALPKLSKAQQEAWARILEWYAQEDRKEAFISGKARWGVSPSAVPAGKNTLDALRDKGLLVYAPRKGYQPLHYTIHPDYLPASEPAAAPESEPATDDNKGQGTMTTVTEINGVPVYVYEDFESIRQGGAINMFDRVGFCRLATSEVEDWVRQDKNNYSKILSGYDEWLAWKETNASEPATDDRPTIAELDETVSNVLSIPTTLTEARLIDSITEARMERDIARNEVASLKGQLDALRVRFAEMEAELAGEAADLEATAVREAHLATRVDELEAENAGLYEQVEKLNDEAENMSAYIVRVEQARDFWKRKSNPTYDSLKAVSDKQDEVIAALETALDLEKNENEKLRAAVVDARRVVITELQAAIDNAPSGFRQAAIEQYMTKALES